MNRYRLSKNDLKKVCGGVSGANNAAGRPGIAAENVHYRRLKRHGSAATHRGASAASTHAGKQGRPHRDGGLKSPPLTRHQQAHTHARAGGRTRARALEQVRRSAGSDRAGGTTATRTRAREQAGTLYMGDMRSAYAIYSVK